MKYLVKNNKAISAIVSSTLLILVIVSAAGLLFTYVNNTSSKLTNLSPERCIDMQTIKEINIENVQYNENLKSVVLTVSRKSSSKEINSIEFSFYKDGNSESFECGKCGSCQIPIIGNQKKYLIPLDYVPEKVDLNVDNCPLGSFKLTAA